LASRLPEVALAIMSDAEHTIIGADAGRRVHAGAVERGSVENIRAVLWYADVRGFTPLADATPGPVLIEVLDDVFEALTGALRPRAAQVLKLLDDGMLASFAFLVATCSETCPLAFDSVGFPRSSLPLQHSLKA
jgi:adenylate cyclase